MGSAVGSSATWSDDALDDLTGDNVVDFNVTNDGLVAVDVAPAVPAVAVGCWSLISAVTL